MTTTDPLFPLASRVDVAPGAVWLRRRLSSAAQQTLLAEAMALLDGPAGGYVPTVRGGGRMRVRMLCLGRHWNALTYRYEAVRSDHDKAPAPPLPPDWAALAIELADEAGFRFSPDICIVNHYGADGRMGLHQDKDESADSLASGAPVVSVSLGATARFVFGGERRKAPAQPLLLESGDAFVFGGASRLCYHGVTRIIGGTAPASLGIDGRVNITFRQY